jgi:hypothetical protein
MFIFVPVSEVSVIEGLLATNDIYYSKMISLSNGYILLIIKNRKHKMSFAFIQKVHFVDVIAFFEHELLLVEDVGLEKWDEPYYKGGRPVLKEFEPHILFLEYNQGHLVLQVVRQLVNKFIQVFLIILRNVVQGLLELPVEVLVHVVVALCFFQDF